MPTYTSKFLIPTVGANGPYSIALGSYRKRSGPPTLTIYKIISRRNFKKTFFHRAFKGQVVKENSFTTLQ